MNRNSGAAAAAIQAVSLSSSTDQAGSYLGTGRDSRAWDSSLRFTRIQRYSLQDGYGGKNVKWNRPWGIEVVGFTLICILSIKKMAQTASLKGSRQLGYYDWVLAIIIESGIVCTGSLVIVLVVWMTASPALVIVVAALAQIMVCRSSAGVRNIHSMFAKKRALIS